MKRILFISAIIVMAVAFGGTMMISCSNAPFGSSGPTGIDTVARLPQLPMITTDSSLISILASPVSGATDMTLFPILKWKPVIGSTKYRIVVSTGRRFGTTVIDDSTLAGTDSLKAITVGLAYSTTYYWAVLAKGNNGKQGWSPIGQFTTKADPLPQLQINYVGQKFGMFIHFGMSTFARYPYPTPGGEWELGGEDENLFHPDSLNLGQWADVAKSAHCKYVVLVVKHHGGFCLWPSNGPWSLGHPHSIAQSSWYTQHGQRDILREFVDSVRSRGMEPGFYFSIWDRTNTANIPMIKGELTEILSNYGDIKVIWFDGWGWQVGYAQIPYDTVANLVHKLNDSLGHHTIISENNHQFKLWHSEIVQYEIPIDGPPLSGNNLPSEGNEPLRGDECWFWHPMNTTLKSTQFVINRIIASNAVNAAYLLDVTPDTLGLIPADQVQAMRDIGTAAVAQGVLQP